MRIGRSLGVAAVFAALPLAAASQAPTVAPDTTERAIGAWLLACAADPMTDRRDCTLRHRLWLLPPAEPGRPGIAFEVVLRGERALPAVTARRLTLADTQRGALAFAAVAELRLGAEPTLEAPCGLEGRDAVCVPAGETGERAAAALPAVSRALVRLRTAASLAGGSGEVYALELAETEAAIAALRETQGRAPPTPPAAEPRGFLEQLERLLRGG